MRAIFLKEFRLGRRALIIWSALMLLTAAFGMIEFYSLKDNLDVLMSSVSGIPRIIRVLFGVDAIAIDTPLGAYACIYYYYYSIVAFAFAVYTGVFIVAKDERFKTSEFLYTKRYTREQIIVAKMLVAFVNMVIMALVMLVGSLVFLVPLFPEANLVPVAIRTTVGMFITMIVFLAIGLLSAATAKSYGQGLLRGFAVLIGCFAVGLAIEYAGGANALDVLSPNRWFNVKSVTEGGFGISYILLAVAVSGVGAWLTLRFFGQRDLHA